MVYKTLVGLKADLSGTVQQPEILDQSDENDEEISDEESSVSEAEEKNGKFVDASRPKNETLEEKKARKKAIRDERAEKRKQKVKKHVKKRQEKVGRKKKV